MLRIAVLICSLATAALAQEHHQSTLDSLKRLDSRERAERMQASRVVQTLKLSAGQRIADIGAGSGLFTRPMAQAVGPTGVVYAVDVDEGALRYIAASAADHKLPQIKTVRAADSDPRIPEPVDLIVIIDTLHHVPDLAAYVRGLKRYLRANGRIAVIDFTERWPRPFENMKYTVEDLDSWMRGAGLTRQEKHDFIDNHFFAIYR